MPRTTLVALALLIATTTHGQTPPTQAAQPAPNLELLDLQHQRNELSATTERLREDIAALQYQLKTRKEYEDVKARLAAAQQTNDADGIKHWQGQVEYYERLDTWNDTNTIPVLQQQLKDKANELSTATQRLGATEVRINRLTNIELLRQDFKTQVSYIYAILVGILIISFFAVIWKDEAVRHHVFAGHAGIQLITLFSIVIAIILFGITGILESKELAALLGSLSGYVLGRVTTGTPATTPIPPHRPEHHAGRHAPTKHD